MKSRSVELIRSVGLLLWAAVPVQQAQSQSATVQIRRPELHDFKRVSSQPGTAEAFFEADLGAKVSGYVAELLVDIGTPVAAGQVLARIAVPELGAARSAASASVDALESEHNRMVTLVERGSVTQRALDEARDRLEGARAGLREIDEQMRYATIEAPFDGIVTSRAIDPGDMVFQASSPKGSDQPLLRVARVDIIRIKTYVPENDAVWADVGDPATVTFDALPGQTFSSRLARISGALDPSTRTMQVEIDVPNPDGRILPGLYGHTEITLESRGGALALPASSVHFTDDGTAYVYVISPDNVAQRRPVSVGFDDGNWLEIADGLSRGDRVADGLVGGLEDGEQVQVVAR